MDDRDRAAIMEALKRSIAWAKTATKEEAQEKLIGNGIGARHSDGSFHLHPNYGGPEIA